MLLLPVFLNEFMKILNRKLIVRFEFWLFSFHWAMNKKQMVELLCMNVLSASCIKTFGFVIHGSMKQKNKNQNQFLNKELTTWSK